MRGDGVVVSTVAVVDGVAAINAQHSGAKVLAVKTLSKACDGVGALNTCVSGYSG